MNSEKKLILKLYVTGSTPRSERAIGQLRRIVQESPGLAANVSVIDVLEHPELANADKVRATPTLVKVSPPPAQRIIGDLSSISQVMAELGIPKTSGRKTKRDVEA